MLIWPVGTQLSDMAQRNHFSKICRRTPGEGWQLLDGRCFNPFWNLCLSLSWSTGKISSLKSSKSLSLNKFLQIFYHQKVDSKLYVLQTKSFTLRLSGLQRLMSNVWQDSEAVLCSEGQASRWIRFRLWLSRVGPFLTGCACCIDRRSQDNGKLLDRQAGIVKGLSLMERGNQDLI